MASIEESIILTHENNFHGLPTMGSVTLDVYKVEVTFSSSDEVNVYGTWQIKTQDGGTLTDMIYLPAESYGVGEYNNWIESPQRILSDPDDNHDYSQYNFHQVLGSPLLKNGGFEEGTTGNFADLTQPNWGLFFSSTNGLIDDVNPFEGVNYALSKGHGGILLQEVELLPGEQVVLSGAMKSFSGENALHSEAYGEIALEQSDYLHSSSKDTLLRITTEQSADNWHTFSATTLVYNLHKDGFVSLRQDNFHDAYVGYDGISITVLPDTDLDGMPDYWETLHTLNPNNPEDALGDLDGDDLLNIWEFRYGANPEEVDTDGDGIPDNDEIIYGLWLDNEADAAWDADGDGLSNLLEHQLGTDPRVADTDGDGLHDGTEHYDLGTDPKDKNDPGYWRFINRTMGMSYTNATGLWEPYRNWAYSVNDAGYIEYGIVAPSNGHYFLQLLLTQFDNEALNNSFDIELSVDGVGVGRLKKELAFGVDSKMLFLLPYLTKGTHSVRITWHPLPHNGSLMIKTLDLKTLVGDTDWITARNEGVLKQLVFPEKTYVSPLSLEGQSRLFDSLKMTASNSVMSVQNIEPLHGPMFSWHTSIPLIETEETQFSILANQGNVTFQTNIIWETFNLLNLSTNDYHIRQGDALRLNAFPTDDLSGSAEVTISSGENYTISPNADQVMTFDTSGQYTITANYTGLENHTTNISLNVVQATFGPNPVCWVGRPREWTCPDMSYSLPVESDPQLSLTRIPASPRGSLFSLMTESTENRYLIARIKEDAAIVDQAEIKGLSIYSTDATRLEIIHTYEDGTQVLETDIYLSEVPDDLNIDLSIFIAGVSFMDGTLENPVLDKTLTAIDFDEYGRATLRFLMAPDVPSGVCHTMKVFQGSEPIGTR